MTSQILVIDGGGTKTLAALFTSGGEELQRWRAGPAHLTNDLTAALEVISTLLQQVFLESKAKPEQLVLVLGLAGACNTRSRQAVETMLQTFPFVAVQLTSDARTSLFGANDGAPVVAVALGTGSVAMRLDHKGQERQFGGWGFGIGDEGGGALMGKCAVRQALWELDCQPSDYSRLTSAICNEIGWEKGQILLWLQQATAHQYARFAPVVVQLAAADCAAALTVLKQHARDVELLIRRSRSGSRLPVVVLGGLAEATIPYLSAKVQSWLQPSKGDAIAGGRRLGQQLMAANTEQKK